MSFAKMFISDAIKYHFKESNDKQNLTLVMYMGPMKFVAECLMK